jgi:hypothetical protein
VALRPKLKMVKMMRLEVVFRAPCEALTVIVDGNRMTLDVPDVKQAPAMPALVAPPETQLPLVVEVAPKKRGRPAKVLTGNLDRFEEWYKVYPRRVGRGQAERAWKSLAPNDELVDTIIAATLAQRGQPDWTKDDGAFIPHPSTWLNGKRWLDQMSAEVAQEINLPYPGKPWAQFIKKGSPAEVLNLMAQVGVDDADAVMDRLGTESVEEVCDWLWSFRAVAF